MRKRRIVVEDDLGNIKSALQQQGYEVLSMNAISQNPDAVVVSGMSDNVMGMQDTQTPAPVIEARGLDTREVLNELERRLSKG